MALRQVKYSMNNIRDHVRDVLDVQKMPIGLYTAIAPDDDCIAAPRTRICKRRHVSYIITTVHDTSVCLIGQTHNSACEVNARLVYRASWIISKFQ